MSRYLGVVFWGATAVACVAQGPWEQCGGMNWTGGTTCVDGWTCIEQNPYYSQCLELPSTLASSVAAIAQASSSATPATTRTPGVTPKLSTSSALDSTEKATPTSSTPALSSVAPTPSSSSSSSFSSPPTSPAATGLTYKASFTHYGAGDSFGSPNCQTNTAACGFFTSPGFAAAVSQNLFGVGPGAGAGPACGTCWKLTGETDSSGNALTNAGTTIIVMVNNLCPASGNPLCAQNGLTGTNQYGANVNFDLCSDSGAEIAFFGNDGVGLAIGTAMQVDCSLYSGTVVH